MIMNIQKMHFFALFFLCYGFMAPFLDASLPPLTDEELQKLLNPENVAPSAHQLATFLGISEESLLMEPAEMEEESADDSSHSIHVPQVEMTPNEIANLCETMPNTLALPSQEERYRYFDEEVLLVQKTLKTIAEASEQNQDYLRNAQRDFSSWVRLSGERCLEQHASFEEARREPFPVLPVIKAHLGVFGVIALLRHFLP